MDGGLGSDAYVIDNKATASTMPAAGDDRIVALSIDLKKSMLASSMQTLTGKAAGNLTGPTVSITCCWAMPPRTSSTAKAALDILVGGGGNDTYIVDDGSDDDLVELADGGTDQVMASVGYTLSALSRT